MVTINQWIINQPFIMFLHMFSAESSELSGIYKHNEIE